MKILSIRLDFFFFTSKSCDCFWDVNLWTCSFIIIFFFLLAIAACVTVMMSWHYAWGLACEPADIPCHLGTPSLLARPFVPLHPEFHSITQRYNTTLPCHSGHSTSARKDSLHTLYIMHTVFSTYTYATINYCQDKLLLKFSLENHENHENNWPYCKEHTNYGMMLF